MVIHPAESICFISGEKEKEKNEKRKKKEKGKKKKKKMRRGGRNFHQMEVLVSRKFLCQTAHEIGFLRAGEGPKHTQEKTVAVLYLRARGDLPSLVFLSTKEAPKMQVPQILWNQKNVRCLSPLKQNDRYPFYKQISSGSLHLPCKDLKGGGFENAGPCSAPVLCPTFRMTPTLDPYPTCHELCKLFVRPHNVLMFLCDCHMHLKRAINPKKLRMKAQISPAATPKSMFERLRPK